MMQMDESRRDILYYLLSAKDPDTGGDLPDREIKAEALTQLIAGSDTTGNTICHVVDLLCRHPEAAKTLQEELAKAFPNAHEEPGWVASFDDCKDLPYCQGVLYETLRLRTTVSVGLPRVVPKGGAMVCGRFFEEGTVLSTPTYTTHRDVRVWGPDALDFKPERWERKGAADLEKAFLGFSYGPRACIGRNVSRPESVSPPIKLPFSEIEYNCTPLRIVN
jgi:benzoate 4-monooxygenase